MFVAILFVPRIHSDKGALFMLSDFTAFFNEFEISGSYTSTYDYQLDNPCAIAQSQKYNGLACSAVLSPLKWRKLLLAQWETVSPDALHCVLQLTQYKRLFAVL